MPDHPAQPSEPAYCETGHPDLRRTCGLGGVLGQDLHVKRVDALCDATLGALRSTSLAVCMSGQGLAAARGLNPKHATKQVDRLLSNSKINVDDILGRRVPYVVGAHRSIVVALDWTDFDADNQATIKVFLIADHGRATPLVWLTVDKRTLKHNRSLYKHRVLVRLAELLPADTKVCVGADRGFGDQNLYRVLTEEFIPNHFRDEGARQDFAGAPGEQGQEEKFLGGEVQLLSAAGGAVAQEVDFEIGFAEGLGNAMRGPAQERTYAGQQLGECEWLNHVIVRAQLESLHAVVDGILSSEHEDESFSASFANAGKHLPTVERGEQHVKDDEVEVNFEGQIETLHAIASDFDDIASLTEPFSEEPGGFDFV